MHTVCCVECDPRSLCSEEAQQLPPDGAHAAPDAQVDNGHEGAVEEDLLELQVPCAGD